MIKNPGNENFNLEIYWILYFYELLFEIIILLLLLEFGEGNLELFALFY